MASMYRMAPLCARSAAPAAPEGMYRLPSLHVREEARGEPTPDLLARAARLVQKPPEDIKMLENRQLKLLKRLENLHSRLVSMKSLFQQNSRPDVDVPAAIATSPPNNLPLDIVINVNPAYLPFSLLAVKKLLNLKINCHAHSSILGPRPAAVDFSRRLTESNPSKPSLTVTLIWKNVGACPELLASTIPIAIRGEVNILRYLVSAVPSRLSYARTSSSPDIDSLLDIAHRLQMHKTSKDRRALTRSLNSKLGKRKWLADTADVSVADIAAFSVLKQLNSPSDILPGMNDWIKKCESSLA